MKDRRTIGIVFLANAITLGVATKMWYLGLPFFVLGITYLKKDRHPDNKDD